MAQDIIKILLSVVLSSDVFFTIKTFLQNKKPLKRKNATIIKYGKTFFTPMAFTFNSKRHFDGAFRANLLAILQSYTFNYAQTQPVRFVVD